MNHRHFLFYDLFLPLCAIAAGGILLDQVLAEDLFRWLYGIHFLGIGKRFAHSALREQVWRNSWAVFAFPLAAFWAGWSRLNLQRDWSQGGWRLQRPLYGLARGFFAWIDDEPLERQRQGFELRLAAAGDLEHRLRGELERWKRAYAELEADYRALEEEWGDANPDHAMAMPAHAPLPAAPAVPVLAAAPAHPRAPATIGGIPMQAPPVPARAPAAPSPLPPNRFASLSRL